MKRGQGGVNAAVLIAVIGAFIILFVLFSQPEEREKFFNETKKNKTTAEEDEDLLLLEKPGRLEFFSKDKNEHTLPSVNLYSRTQSKELFIKNSLYIKNGVFDKQDQQLNFSVDSPENIDNILLTFNVLKRKGRLIIVLNENEIFNKEITTTTIDPIRISKGYLKRENTIIFSVSGVGFKFWTTNEYNLEEIKIVASVTDYSTQKSEIKFLLESEELSNLKKAELKFVPDCRQGDVGLLKIDINNRNVFSSVPDCGLLRPLEINPSYLIEGENKLTFESDQGRYLIDQIMVETELKEQPEYTYYFDLSEDQFDDVKNNKANITLTFRFTDDEEEKEAKLFINGYPDYLSRTTKAYWSKKYKVPPLEEGSNSLKIIPKVTLEVRELEIRFEKK